MPEDLGAAVKDQNAPDSKLRPDPVFFVSSLQDSHGEEWNSTFQELVKRRYPNIGDEGIKNLITQAGSKADELARLIA